MEEEYRPIHVDKGMKFELSEVRIFFALSLMKVLDESFLGKCIRKRKG